jgi:predicted transposase/invertase (TIGR01784 family)
MAHEPELETKRRRLAVQDIRCQNQAQASLPGHKFVAFLMVQHTTRPPMTGDSAETVHRNIKSRAIRGVCDLYANQPGRGTAYGDFEQSFQITFCGYTVFPERPDFISRYSFRDENGIELANNIGIIFIELTKLDEVLKKPVKDMTRLEQWCVFFGCADKPKYRNILNKLNSTREDIKVATELLTSISRDERERALFRSRRIAQLDMEHNYAVVRQEGRREGHQEGRREGRQEGRQEGQARVIALMREGYSPDQIESILNETQQQ